jgi:hypothetical protein
MKIKDLIALLSKVDPESEVFTECPETGGSWSIEMVVSVDDKVIIAVDEYDGPSVPDNFKELEVKP